MIIKSHIRGSTRAASAYLKAQGKNERTRLVEITDKDATCLDEAFQNMWAVASSTRVQKTLHHNFCCIQKGIRLLRGKIIF